MEFLLPTLQAADFIPVVAVTSSKLNSWNLSDRLYSYFPIPNYTLSVTLLKLNALTRTPGTTLLPKRCTVLRASTA